MKEGLFALIVGLFQEITDVILAVIFAGWELNRNIYTTLMFNETEFRMTCRDREKNALYVRNSYRRHRLLEISISYFH